jgi:hypothetical protein
MANLPDEINALKEKIAMLEQRRDLPTVEKDERVAITNEIVAYVNEITSIRQQITQQGILPSCTSVPLDKFTHQTFHSLISYCSKHCTTSIPSPIWMPFDTPLSVPKGAAGRGWVGSVP